MCCGGARRGDKEVPPRPLLEEGWALALQLRGGAGSYAEAPHNAQMVVQYKERPRIQQQQPHAGRRPQSEQGRGANKACPV